MKNDVDEDERPHLGHAYFPCLFLGAPIMSYSRIMMSHYR